MTQYYSDDSRIVNPLTPTVATRLQL